MSADIRTIEKYAQLENKRAELEDQLTAVKAQLDEFRPAVLEYFSRHSIQRITKEGRTLSLRQEFWAGRAEEFSHEEACAALVAAGLSEFAAPRINAQSFSAWVRERIAEGEKPEDVMARFGGRIKVTEVFKVGSRRS